MQPDAETAGRLRSTWRRLLEPASVGIIGISSKPGPFQVGGRALLAHLAKHGFAGEVFPISRSAAEIEGYRTYGSLAQVPLVVDCLVVAVAAEAVGATIREALDRGTRAFAVVSSGFAEAGAEGAAWQEEIAAVVQGAGAVMLGPNTTGYVNFGKRIALSSTSRLQGALPEAGPVGMVVQSGALGSALLDLAKDRCVGLSYLISSGNEGSHGLADFIDVLVDDPATRVIAVYAEGFKAPARFVAAAERARAAGKPLVLLKAGVTEAGQKAAAGHTGALAGSARVQAALFRQLGIVTVRTLEALVDVSGLLARQGAQFGRKLGILTISGGLGGLLADDLARHGEVELPDVNETTRRRLRAYLPPYFTLTNPLDNGGVPFRRAGEFQRCLQDFTDDQSFDGIVVAATPVVAAWGAEMADAVEAVAERTGKPIAVCLQAGAFCAGTVADLRARFIPAFTSVAECGAALSAVVGFRPGRIYPRRMMPRTGLALPDAGVLDEAASKALLMRYGMRTPREMVVAAADMAALGRAAAGIGYPVVLKALLPDVAHKTELGLVALGLADEGALMEAAARQSAAGPTGFLVAEMVRPAAEVLVGVTVDPQFGPVLTFGAGGLYAEIFDDVAQLVLPADAEEMREMVAGTRVARVLAGARGQPALDVESVIGFLCRLSELALDIGPRLVGIEVNPLAVFPDGQGVSALDAKVFLARLGA